MAVKRDAGCSYCQGRTVETETPGILDRSLKKHGSAQACLDNVALGESLFLRLMKELLAFGDDADKEISLWGEVSFPVEGFVFFVENTTHAR